MTTVAAVTDALLKPPIFIGGMFKSGTSLLRAMLGQHSAISAGLETAWFQLDWGSGLGRGEEPLADYVSRTAGFYGEDPKVAQAMAVASPDPEAFIDQLLGAHARREGKVRWAEKTPGNVRFADRILRRWPDARLLHIIRDPRDTFASLRQIGKWDTVPDFASRWCETFGPWVASKKAGVVTDANALELRYESLVRAPTATMGMVLEFLEEPWEPATGQHQGQAQDFEQVQAATGKSSTTLARLAEPLSDSRIGIWPQTLSANDLAGAQAFADDQGLGDLYRAIIADSPVSVSTQAAT